MLTSKTWWLSTGERFVKTFLQGYIAFWLLTTGLGGTPAEVVGADAFQTLFTMDNVKAGIAAAFLSFVTSIVSTPLGVDSNSPAITVKETSPPQAA